MALIHAKEKGIHPNTDISEALNRLFLELQNTCEEKTLVLESGNYYLSSESCPKEHLFITNTIGDNEWKNEEIPHLLTVGLLLKNIQNLTLEGSDTTFIIDGQVTNMAVIGCQNLVFKNITFQTVNPDLHEFKVIKKSACHIDFELDKESEYTKQGSNYYFIGKDYKHGFTDFRRTAHWIGYIAATNPNGIKRIAHPFMFARKMEECAPHQFRVSYIKKPKCNVGDRFYLFDVRRKNVGIFVDGCKDITLENVTQRFNYSLAFVGQDTENITIDGACFAPENGGAKLMSSIADFLQICMCKGDIIIKNSYFEGAGDDCLNIHGIHFKITKVLDKRLVVRFSHPQTHGFNPLHAGDNIEFIDTASLLTKGEATILQSAQIDEYYIALTLDNTTGCKVGDVIENVSRCPNLFFANNTLNRIITRGLLITTRGKVLVENNLFVDTSMTIILFSNDAKSWYESGRITDVTIRGNTFQRCPMKNIMIKPENRTHSGAVHGKFLIENNHFASNPGGIFAKSTQKIIIRCNKINIKISKFIKTRNVDELEQTNNGEYGV